MADYIRLQKVSQDADMTELQVSAGNAVISATSKIYITGSILEELRDQISAFLAETDLEGYWENDVPGIGGPPCIAMKILPQSEHALALVEMYMELNDGGCFMDHHCRFYVQTSRTALKEFSASLLKFSQSPIGAQIELS